MKIEPTHGYQIMETLTRNTICDEEPLLELKYNCVLVPYLMEYLVTANWLGLRSLLRYNTIFMRLMIS